MKILSINLWFDKYANKTLAQLASFRFYGYKTYAATVNAEALNLECRIYQICEDEKLLISSRSFPKKPLNIAYFKIFQYLFQYCITESFTFIYIRRLMSKFIFVAPLLKSISRKIPVIYEIPTYPYDRPSNLLTGIRDFIELTAYKLYDRFIALTVVVLRSPVKLRKNWTAIENGIDISNYQLADIPQKDTAINFIAIANIASWHRYDRMLSSIKHYNGSYKLHFIIISPQNNDLTHLRENAHRLGIEESITFLEAKSLPEICEISRCCHIGVGQLSDSSENTVLMSSLKNKDYCALGLPFFSTCPDNSFNADFPYFYLIKNEEEIDLNKIIQWYEHIYENMNYKKDMYDYAKNNLQYFSLVKLIEKKCLNRPDSYPPN